MNPVELGSRDRDPTRLGARGQQQPVVAKRAPVGERDARLRGVDRGHRGVGLELDLMLLVEVLLVDVGLLARRLTAQIVLGQWRTFVR